MSSVIEDCTIERPIVAVIGWKDRAVLGANGGALPVDFLKKVAKGGRAGACQKSCVS